MKTSDLKGAWTPAGTLPESFKKLPDDGNWKEVKDSLPGKKVNASQAPKVFVSLQPAELMLLRGEPNYALVVWDEAAVGEQHRQRRLPDGPDRHHLLPDVRALVLCARLHGTVDVRDREPARRVQADPARARAVARPRIGAGHDPGGRSDPARAGAADRAGEQDAGRRPKSPTRAGRRSSSRSRRRPSSARSTPTRTSSRSATSITCASRACGSCRAPPRVRGR